MAFHRIKRMLGVVIPTSAAVLAISNGAVLAQETCADVTIPAAQQGQTGFPGWMPHLVAEQCRTRAGGNQAKGCYRVDGSDTLTDVIRASIVASFAPDSNGAPTRNGACINYHNVGSGQAETNMLYGIGNVTSGTAKQGIGPMSRNFKAAIITGATPVRSDWAPTEDNVLAVDGALWCFQPRTGGVADLDDDLTNSGNCRTECPKVTDGTISGMAVVLGGYPSSGAKSTGTTAECADPCRVCLLNTIAQKNGVAAVGIDHILRRDDKSGTQDTIREKLNLDFWCNGKSEGNMNQTGANLLNEDLDPIRRPCMGTMGGLHKPTRCTYYPTSINCDENSSPIGVGATKEGWTNSYGQEIKCTQGTVVALSESDIGKASSGRDLDLTTSIGARVAAHSQVLVGLAGLAEWDAASSPNNCVNINKTSWNYFPNIYAGAYKFSRLLYLQRNPTFSDSLAGVEAGRTAQETELWTWIQGHGCAPGLETFDRDFGFLPKFQAGCATNCLNGTNGATLTCLGKDPGASTPKQHIGDETSNNSCSVDYPCISNNQKAPAAGGTCGGVGTVCPVIPANGASGSACNLNAKCTSTVCTPKFTGEGGVCN